MDQGLYLAQDGLRYAKIYAKISDTLKSRIQSVLNSMKIIAMTCKRHETGNEDRLYEFVKN